MNPLLFENRSVSGPQGVGSANFKKFQDLDVTTLTIIAVSNLNININKLFKYLPVTEYILVQKRRGRKKKTEHRDPNEHIQNGSIICLQYGSQVRGTVLKKKSKSKKSKTEKNYFLNSVTVEIVIDKGKMINIKISSNGKFQITGCKDMNHVITGLQYLFHHMYYSQKYTGEDIYKMDGPEPKFIFDIVMKNFDFKLKFGINRYNLDDFITNNTDFISLFEDEDKITYVNIKYKLNNYEDENVTQMTLDYDNLISHTPFCGFNFTSSTTVPYSEFKKLCVDEKVRRTANKKAKYHTFLVFQSGAVIQSGRGPEMEQVYNKFMTTILGNKEKFIEITE